MDLLAPAGEDSCCTETETEDGHATDGNEAGFDDDEDSLLVDTALWAEDAPDPDVADDTYGGPMHDDMSPQEEEEEEAFRLAELYDALGKLTERDL